MRKRYWIVGGLATLGLMALLAPRLQGPRPGDAVANLPAVLQQVEEIGELRTARHAYTQVVRHETSAGASGVAAVIPGADQLSRAATRNQVVMEVAATVDAGIDLRRAEVTEAADGTIRIKLPSATVYKPQVDARVFDAKRGLLWRDPNLTVSAIAQVQAQMRSRAIADGIRTEAERNAITRLRSLIPNVREGHIQIVPNSDV